MSKKKFGIKVKEFLNLSQEKQSEWVDINIPDYGMKLLEDGYLGAWYPAELDWDEYLNNREDYGIADMIASQDPEITNERKEQIDAGAELTENEKLKLAMAVAENDVDMWLTHHSLEIQFLDGSLHACFVGYPLGAGGLDFKYFCSFKTYQSMLETISQEPISFLD